MSITDKIARLQTAKSDLKTAINAKTDEQHQITNETLDEYADFVDSIEIPTPVIQPKTITANGTYTAPSGVDGFNPVTVFDAGVDNENLVVKKKEITIGANNIKTTLEAWDYVKALINEEFILFLIAQFPEHDEYVYDQINCFYNTSFQVNPSVRRYRNGTFANQSVSPSYSAVLVEGDMAVCYYITKLETSR